MAIAHGASALGLVSSMPSGPGVIPDELIEKIARDIPPGVASFLLTSELDAGTIIEQQKRFCVNTLQICDRIEPASYSRIRLALPGISIVQVIHVQGERSVTEAISVAPCVDAVLLDSGNQSLAVKELGGTGRTHDWLLSRRIRESVDVPVFLSGGLNVANVAEGIRQVGPFGVDVCSGVRTNGQLDEKKLRSFFQSVKAYEALERSCGPEHE